MAEKRIKNLKLRLEVLGLMIDVTPFRWASYAFKTKWNILGRRRSTQLFAGPLHVWTFPREGVWSVSLEVGLDGSVHGRFTPDGHNALPYFWRWLIGRPTPDAEEER